MKPPLTHCCMRGFSMNPRIRPPSSSSSSLATPHCECGWTRVTVVAAPCPRWELEGSTEVDVGDAISVGKGEGPLREAIGCGGHAATGGCVKARVEALDVDPGGQIRT